MRSVEFKLYLIYSHDSQLKMISARATLAWRRIPALDQNDANELCQWSPSVCDGSRHDFACISVAEKDFSPTAAQLLSHPLAMVSLIPKDAVLFAAGEIAVAAAKTVTAPLDRIKLLLQANGLRAGQGVKKGNGFIEALTLIEKEEGIKGYWKGNLPQVIRSISYGVVQVLAYDFFKKLFEGKNREPSEIGILGAGVCAGITSTLVTYPLDVLRLRLAVEPGYRTMSEVALNMIREEGFGSFYNGLGLSLIGITQYFALSVCVFDLAKIYLPIEYRKRPEVSRVTALVSAAVATTFCYPLDTVRRQMQMKGTPYQTVVDGFAGIVARDGVRGLYRGFVANALKSLPNRSTRHTTFRALKGLIAAAENEFHKIKDENHDKREKVATDC